MTDSWIVEPSGGGPPVDLLPPENSSFVCLASAGKWRTVCCCNDDGRYHLVVWNPVNQEKQAILDTSAWKLTGNEDPVIRIAAPQNGKTAWVYAIVGRKMWAWKLGENTFTGQRVPLQPETSRDVWQDLEEEPSPFSAFTVEWTDHKSPILLLGTASGLVLSVKQTHIPPSFKAYKVDVPRSRFSFFQHRPPCDCITSLVLSNMESSFVSICTSGRRLDHWKQTDGQLGPAFALENSTEKEASLFDFVDQHFRGCSDSFFHMEKVLHAQSRGDRLFALTLCRHQSGTYALYWVYLQDLAFKGLFAVDCFPHPERVKVLDHLVAKDGTPYAILTADPSDPAIMASLRVDQGSISYCSLEQGASPLLGSCSLDSATHGVLFLRSNFTESRARLLMPESPHIPSSKWSVDAEERLFQTYNQRFQFQDIQSMMFPQSTDAEIESCIIACAKRIQREVPDNPMTRHEAYIEFLQDDGLYKNMSLYGKWSLVAIGQEICAYQAIRDNPDRMESIVNELRPSGLAEGLAKMQAMVKSPRAHADMKRSWLHYLKTAIDSAMSYRETHCTRSLSESIKPSYDVASNHIPIAPSPLPIPVWTSHVQDILLKQVLLWKDTNCANVSANDMQDIFQYTLQALSDSYRSDPSQKGLYVDAQRTIFELAHETGKHDEWLFQLCLAHGYFHGLCKITGTYVPGTFDLVSLSGTVGPDIESGEELERYIIKWFAERNRMGLAAKFGMAFPDVFVQLMDEKVPGLEQYRWMVAARSKDFDTAANSLVRNAKDPSKSLDQVETSLSLSKLMDHAKCIRDGHTTERSVLIEKDRERVMLQRKYFENKRALSAKELLNSCLRLIDEDENRLGDETLELFFDSLAVCTTFASDEEVSDAALLVWFKAIAKDRSQWMGWVRHENDLSDAGLLDRVRATTLFGKLVEKTLEVQEWENVCHFDAIYSFAKEKWDRVKELDTEMFGSNSMIRLLGLVSSADALAARNMDMEE